MPTITTTQTNFTSDDIIKMWLQHDGGPFTKLVLSPAIPVHVEEQIQFDRIIYEDVDPPIDFEYIGEESHVFNNADMEVDVDETLTFIKVKVTAQGVVTTLPFHKKG